jgi:formyltetrahydrofolate deformylase
MRTFRLVIACPDRVGIVAKVSNFLATYNGWITEASHHSDNQSGWFFMRHEIRADSLPFDLDGFRQAFAPIAREFSMEWRVTDSAVKKRVVLMASRESHCLADLLHRWHSDELDCDIPCVISNHDDLRSMVEWHAIPYFHVPVNSQDKQPALYADLTCATLRRVFPARHQYPPQLSAVVCRGQAVSPGVIAGGQADWRDLALCHRRA